METLWHIYELFLGVSRHKYFCVGVLVRILLKDLN